MKAIGYVSALALVLAACSNGEEANSSSPDETGGVNDAAADTAETSGADGENASADESASMALANSIDHERRDENRARDEWRHPSETLAFFGLEPDMTIVEILPGNGGWYTQILTPYTAEQGRLIGVTYPDSLWTQMFPSWSEDNYERFGADITQMGRYMSVEGVVSTQPIVGYTIDNIPDLENGEADAVLFFRALHHLFRFEEPMIDTALAEVFDMLAPGGVVGVVQHRAPESADDAFASGDNGYLKQSDVIAAFERAGFVLEASSEINANPNDPVDGFVWRLPPTTTNNPDTLAIGESDRMTLRFRKPE
ncbi:class I SAM-dependent methyltransferase [Hyphobacterium sp.]|jgi:predicted methyltransferase|uniref:class I SAM-dependent methyltransferase n=1 Tax=Hyphobacterium sp. TaxID=2004662 RepID=UPI003BAC69CD